MSLEKIVKKIENTAVSLIKKLDYSKPTENVNTMDYIKYYSSIPLKFTLKAFIYSAIGTIYSKWQDVLSNDLKKRKGIFTEWSLGYSILSGSIQLALLYKWIPTEKIPNLPGLLRIPSNAALYAARISLFVGFGSFVFRAGYYYYHKIKNHEGVSIGEPISLCGEGGPFFFKMTKIGINYFKKITKNHKISINLENLHKKTEKSFTTKMSKIGQEKKELIDKMK